MPKKASVSNVLKDKEHISGREDEERSVSFLYEYGIG